MAERAGLTSRTFARRFRASTGYEPMDYVQSLRIEEAKQLLETDDLNVEDVGHAVGYEDPTSFRRLFKRKSGLTPAAYRRKFAKLVPNQTASAFPDRDTGILVRAGEAVTAGACSGKALSSTAPDAGRIRLRKT